MAIKTLIPPPSSLIAIGTSFFSLQKVQKKILVSWMVFLRLPLGYRKFKTSSLSYACCILQGGSHGSCIRWLFITQYAHVVRKFCNLTRLRNFCLQFTCIDSSFKFPMGSRKKSYFLELSDHKKKFRIFFLEKKVFFFLVAKPSQPPTPS